MVPILSTQRRWPLRWWDSNHQQPWVLILNRHYSIPKRWSSVMWLYKWTFPSQITPIKLSTMRPRKISCTWEAGRNKSYTSTFHLGIMNSRNNDLKRDCTGVAPEYQIASTKPSTATTRIISRTHEENHKWFYAPSLLPAVSEAAVMRMEQDLQSVEAFLLLRVLKLWRLQMIIIWQRYF